MDDLVGTLLDHFQVLELLGRGGMGAVYKARDVRLQRDVALKVMHRHIAEQADFKARFLQEARSAAQLDHAGIVKVHYFGQVDTLLYIVMQFIAGANLREMLEALKGEGNWVPLDEAVQLVRQVSLALDYAHRRGVLHRDIKPKNIMIEPEPSNGLPYRPVITDLGLAKLANSDLVTRPGSSMGTPAYMSPEQALGRETDARSDVYSLGVLLYELAVGRVPFPAKTITEAIRYHTREAPPAPRSIRPELPQALERIILHALEKEPDHRFAQAAALAEALEHATAAVTEVASVPSVFSNAVSLLTQYEQSLGKPRGSSILEEFDTPADFDQDMIQVMVDGQTIATLALDHGVTTIGRKEDNDIVLDDSRASRHHAQISYDGAGYRVVDQGSSNGTFLANVRLLPGVYESWTPDKPLRIGGTWLHLVAVQQPAADPLAGSRAVPVASIQPESGTGKGVVGLLVEPKQLSVKTGESTMATLVVLNQGPLVDHFQVSVEGVPADWVSVSPALIRLLPGQQGTASMMLRPPHAPQTRAGHYDLVIRVTSQSDATQTAHIDAGLMVGAYHHYEVDLRPRRQSSVAEGKFAVQVENYGNTDLTVRFEAMDMEDGCRYTFAPASLSVGSGKARQTQLRVYPKIPLRAEEARPYLFTVTARPEDAPELTQQIQGTWVQTSPAYQVRLDPSTQSGTTQGAFSVHLVNTGRADLTLSLDANDAEGACRFDLSQSHIDLPAGQEQVVPLTVRCRTSQSSAVSRAYPFTVTVQPVDAPGFSRQAQGEWVPAVTPPLASPADAVLQPVSPVSVAPPQPASAVPQKPRRFWGCAVLLLGLFLTLVVGIATWNIAYENLGLGESGGWVSAMFFGGLCLLLTIRGTVRVWRRGSPPDQVAGSSAGPGQSQSRPFWGTIVFLVGMAVTVAAGLVAGNLAFEVLDLDDAGAWFVAGTVWLVGLIVTIRTARKIAQSE